MISASEQTSYSNSTKKGHLPSVTSRIAKAEYDKSGKKETRKQSALRIMLELERPLHRLELAQLMKIPQSSAGQPVKELLRDRLIFEMVKPGTNENGNSSHLIATREYIVKHPNCELCKHDPRDPFDGVQTTLFSNPFEPIKD